MRAELVDELEEFVRRGRLWQRADVTALIERLEAEAVETGDPIEAPFSGKIANERRALQRARQLARRR